MGRIHKSWALLSFLIVFTIVPEAAAQTWISGVTSSTNSTSATITWATAVAADSQVKYSVSTSYGSRTSLNPARVTAHNATLTSLTAATTYHFRVMSRDASGILVTSLDYTFTTKALPVSVSVSPSSASVGSGKTQQFTATVTNASNQAVTWSASGGTISSAGLFTAPTVSADQTVTVKATSVADTSKSTTATVTVKAPVPVLSVSQTDFSFTAQQGGGNPSPGSLTISNTGGGTLTYSAISDAAWLAVSPSNGTAPRTLQILASVAGLVPGNYTGHVTISAAGVQGSPVTVLVSLTIAAVSIQHSVDLSWNASSSDGIVSYSAYRSTMQGGPYILVASAISGLSYTDSTVQSGVTYYYVVTAFDDRAQESVYSNEARSIVP